MAEVGIPASYAQGIADVKSTEGVGASFQAGRALAAEWAKLSPDEKAAAKWTTDLGLWGNLGLGLGQMGKMHDQMVERLEAPRNGDE